MNLKQYAEGRHISPSTVTKYIKNNNIAFSGLTTRKGNNVELSDAAIALLNLHFNKPVTDIIPASYSEELNDLKSQLLAAQQKIIDLQEERAQSMQLIAEAKAQQLLIDTTKEELTAAQKDNFEKQSIISNLEKENDTIKGTLEFTENALKLAQEGQNQAEQKSAELEEEINRLKKRSLWQRIRNK